MGVSYGIIVQHLLALLDHWQAKLPEHHTHLLSSVTFAMMEWRKTCVRFSASAVGSVGGGSSSMLGDPPMLSSHIYPLISTQIYICPYVSTLSHISALSHALPSILYSHTLTYLIPTLTLCPLPSSLPSTLCSPSPPRTGVSSNETDAVQMEQVLRNGRMLLWLRKIGSHVNMLVGAGGLA